MPRDRRRHVTAIVLVVLAVASCVAMHSDDALVDDNAMSVLSRNYIDTGGATVEFPSDRRSGQPSLAGTGQPSLGRQLADSVGPSPASSSSATALWLPRMAAVWPQAKRVCTILAPIPVVAADVAAELGLRKPARRRVSRRTMNFGALLTASTAVIAYLSSRRYKGRFPSRIRGPTLPPQASRDLPSGNPYRLPVIIAVLFSCVISSIILAFTVRWMTSFRRIATVPREPMALTIIHAG